jgi:uncharacterized membrane protein
METGYLPVPLGFRKQVLELIVLAGVVCLLISLLYLVRPDRMTVRVNDWLKQKRRAQWVLALLILMYTLTFGRMVVQRHYHFNSACYELGLQEQVIWNTSRGHLYQNSIIEVENYMGEHFQPLLIILAPIYWILPSVYWLLVFQTIVLASGAIPIFRLAQRRLGSPVAGLIFASVYLLYPAIGYINRFDFHWEATVIPLLLAAVDSVDAGQQGWASLYFMLAMLGKEEIGLTVAALSLVIASRGSRKFGGIWAVAGVCFSLIALFVLVRSFRPSHSDTLNRYTWLGSTPTEMLATLLTHPQVLLREGRPLSAFSLGLQLFSPLAFLPLLRVETLAILPSIGYNLLSSFSPQHTVYYQYVAPTVPCVLIGAIGGMSKLQRWLSKRINFPYVRWGVWAGLVLYAVWAAAVNSPLADVGTVPPAWTRLPNETAVRAALSYVPPEAAVFTTNPYAPHLSQRYTLLVFVYPQDVELLNDADTAFLNLKDHRSVVSELACDDYRHFLEVAAQGGFGAVFDRDGVIVLRRGQGTPLAGGYVNALLKTCEGVEPF